ncbi:MAG: hypothetical protein KF864_07480 [Phycisphaeraceae bacterium]|nr:hypothetical protein [Phycisphaeraceae bacterium]
MRLSHCAIIVAAGLSLCAGLAAGQAARPIDAGVQGAGRSAMGVPITVDRLGQLRVTSLGHVLEDTFGRAGGEGAGGGYSPRNCPVLATHTDASFSGGGNFTVQAGFGAGEFFAATYTLPAEAFPIRFKLGEVIFATSNATQNTTTVWGVRIYQGPPSGGALLLSENSDDVVLPHLRMGPGTNATRIEFSIDPNDPEQVIIQNNGSRQFTIAFGIIQHNNQTSNPCFQGPPTCCNAFPTTDVSGLAAPSANWLFGLNCGSLGCPPNGGWSTFGNLNQLCRPSGDIVVRATWESVSCAPSIGACCLPSGSCVQLTATQCEDQAGVYQGDASDCANVTCPQPTGACCFSSGFCTPLQQPQCIGAGGTYLGNGTVCGSGSTCPTGACCLPDGSCQPGITSTACGAQGGLFRGVGSNCASANCPQPQGACCAPTGFCLIVTEATCTGIGGTWAGALTTCNDTNGNGQADVCEEGGRCVADYNQDGGVDGQDVEAFFLDWELGESAADVNEDGGVDGQDVEYFFTRWESGEC